MLRNKGSKVTLCLRPGICTWDTNCQVQQSSLSKPISSFSLQDHDVSDISSHKLNLALLKLSLFVFYGSQKTKMHGDGCPDLSKKRHHLTHMSQHDGSRGKADAPRQVVLLGAKLTCAVTDTSS